jgi:hypothetical protein
MSHFSIYKCKPKGSDEQETKGGNPFKLTIPDHTATFVNYNTGRRKLIRMPLLPSGYNEQLTAYFHDHQVSHNFFCCAQTKYFQVMHSVYCYGEIVASHVDDS